MDIATSTVVGRERELQVIVDRCTLALSGHPGIIVISGIAHVGATTLVTEAIARVRRSHSPAPAVVRISALSWERDLEGELAQRLCAAPGVSNPVPVPQDTDQGPALASALLERFRDGSASGLILVVEDAHYADALSLRALSSAVHRLHEEKVAVILEVADSEVNEPNLAAVLRAHRGDAVQIGGLRMEDIQDLAHGRGISLSADAARRLATYTSGLPGLVVELLEEFPASLWESAYGRLPAPRSIRQELAAALDSSSPDVGRLVQALAVIGSGSDITEVANLVSVDDPLPAVDEVRRRGLVRVVTQQGRLILQFASPMLAAAAYDATDLVERQRLHREAAAHTDDAYTRLHHLAEATTGPDAELAEEMAALAETFAATGQWSQAGSSWVIASRGHPDREQSQHYLIAAVDALTSAGDLHLAESLAFELEGFPASPERNSTLGYLSLLKGRRGRAHALLTELHDEVAGSGTKIETTVTHRLALNGLADFDGARIVTKVERCIQVAKELGTPMMPAAIEAHTLGSLALGMAGRHQEAESNHQGVLRLLDEGAQRQRALMSQGWRQLATDRPQSAIQDLQASIPQTYWQGSSRVALWGTGWLARGLMEVGEWDSAMAVVNRGMEMLDRSGMDLIAPLIHWTGAEVSALRGDSTRADWHVSQCLALSSDYMIMRLPTAMARARVAQTRADADALLHALEPIATEVRPESVDEPGFWPWHDLWASALVLSGRLEEADEFLLPHEERARQVGRHSAMARLGMARGRLLSVSGDIDAARAQFESALELLEGSGYTYLRTRVNYLYGQALRRAGKRRDAGVVLRRALDGFASFGAKAYVERCRRELQAGGAGGARPASFDVESLTPQEQAVARLVAQGMSNADAARELFISVKTVQFHLTRVYSKLGLRSRTELAAHRSELTETND